MFCVDNVKINHLTEPLGVRDKVSVSWELKSSKRAVFQKSYKIEVSEYEDFSSPIFSVINTSDSCRNISVDDVAYKEFTRYYVRVQSENTCEEISEWSKTASFVTGPKNHLGLKGKFISVEADVDAGKSSGSILKKLFSFNKKIKSAFAVTSALGMYRFYINGKQVGSDELSPGWTNYSKRLLYQTYDIYSLLKSGKNDFSCLLGAGWYKGKMGFILSRNIYGKESAFYCQIHILYEDGTEEEIVSDESWLGTKDTPLVFSEIYDGEIYDARIEASEHDFNKVHLVEYPLCNMQPQFGGTNKTHEVFPVKEKFYTPQGDQVLDFGQNMAGKVCIKVKGKCGDRVELHFFETLDSKGNVYTENLRTAKNSVTYILKGGEEEEYTPFFTYQGFRYAKVLSWPGEIQKENIKALALYTDMNETGFFECSNKALNQLEKNIRWGLKSNFVDIPTDCPQRDERLGWTGDAQIFCRTSAYLMDVYNFYEKWLMDVCSEQLEEGEIPHIVPNILEVPENHHPFFGPGKAYAASGWADAVVICPWTLYSVYGDKEILNENYIAMKKWIDFMISHSNDYIFNYRMQFGDWLALDSSEGSYTGATPTELVCTAYFAYTVNIFSKVCEVLEKAEAGKRYKEVYETILQSFRKHFVLPDGSMVSKTQTAQILPLHFNLLSEESRKIVSEELVSLIQKKNGHLDTGFLGTPFICHALSESGKIKEAYELLLKDDFPSWLYQVKKGATTIWEHWDGLKEDGSMWSADMNSFNHYSYGSVGAWLYEVAGGIKEDEKFPGFKHFVLNPHVGGGLSFVHVSYKSEYGIIDSFWKIEKDFLDYQFSVPCNSQGTLVLENCREVIESDGLDYSLSNGVFSCKIYSGTYKIKLRLA